jgi:hypothetical protein
VCGRRRLDEVKETWLSKQRSQWERRLDQLDELFTVFKEKGA